MSTSPDNELDLEQLLFLPAWAQQPPETKRYAHTAPTEEERPRRKPARPFRPGAGRADARPDRRQPPRHSERPQRDFPPPPDVSITFLPDEKGVDSVAKQIRATGRAYPLFEIAQLILKKPERQQVRFEVIRKPDGEVVQPLYLCALDDTLWLSEADALSHVLEHHFATFYQTERIPADPPKGTYTFVAQCGMSGVILGPPNYHSYQSQLRKLHTERFSHMPFEAFKARVKIVKDEAVVKKWLEDQSWHTEYIGLNLPEAHRLTNREDVERHFREIHLPNVVQQVETHTLHGEAIRHLREPRLQRLVRHNWEQQKRFPLKVVNILSQQFASRGLQFFKVNKTITHVAVSRPHFLDLENTPVSEGVRRIVDFINAHPNCTRRRLFEALAPSPSGPPPESETREPTQESPHEPTPEQTVVIGDLHWLIHQGHVIEFANGLLETAKRPNLKPPKPETKKQPRPTEKPAVQPAAAESIATEAAHAEAAPECAAAASDAAAKPAGQESAAIDAAAAPTGEGAAPEGDSTRDQPEASVAPSEESPDISIGPSPAAPEAEEKKSTGLPEQTGQS